MDESTREQPESSTGGNPSEDDMTAADELADIESALDAVEAGVVEDIAVPEELEAIQAEVDQITDTVKSVASVDEPLEAAAPAPAVKQMPSADVEDEDDFEAPEALLAETELAGPDEDVQAIEEHASDDAEHTGADADADNEEGDEFDTPADLQIQVEDIEAQEVAPPVEAVDGAPLPTEPADDVEAADSVANESPVEQPPTADVSDGGLADKLNALIRKSEQQASGASSAPTRSPSNEPVEAAAEPDHVADEVASAVTDDHSVDPVAEVATIDSAVSSEVDALLETGFDTVDAVLDDVFDPGLTEPEDTFGTPEEMRLEEDLAPQEAEAADSAVAGESPEVPEPMRSEVQPADSAVPASDVAAESGAVAAHANEMSAEPPPVPVDSAELEAPKELTDADESEPDSKKAQPESAEEADVGPKDGASAEIEDKVVHGGRAGEVIARLEPHVITALTAINYPLRLLPSRGREIVEWIAISLIFWVPIVWFIVLFM